jgi:hypothetical protein
MAMHKETQAVKREELAQKGQLADIMSRIKILEIQGNREDRASAEVNKTETIRIKEANANARTKAALEKETLI